MKDMKVIVEVLEQMVDLICTNADEQQDGEMMAIGVLLRGIIIAQSVNKLPELMDSQAQIIESIRNEKNGYIKTVADA